tara:strand:- start:24461 stop:24673 length:213 start_codon:yes stop_codon:yes gene_type:complete
MVVSREDGSHVGLFQQGQQRRTSFQGDVEVLIWFVFSFQEQRVMQEHENVFGVFHSRVLELLLQPALLLL